MPEHISQPIIKIRIRW